MRVKPRLGTLIARTIPQRSSVGRIILAILVAWETPPVKAAPAGDRVTFVFAGGLGFISEPKTNGFALDINGKEAIRFDVPEPNKWQSADKRVELRFVARRTVSVDQFGLFYLTIPRNMLQPGEPVPPWRSLVGDRKPALVRPLSVFGCKITGKGYAEGRPAPFLVPAVLAAVLYC